MGIRFWRSMFLVVAILVGLTVTGRAAVIGTDTADNYAAWTNGANAGTGFEPWELTIWQQYAGHFLGSSTNGGSGIDVDTNGVSFGMYANPPESNSYANAVRYFSSGALTEGQSFTISLGVNYWNGNKGIDLYNASGQTLFNLNFGTNSGGIKLEYGSPTQTNLPGWENDGNGYNYILTFTKMSGNITGLEMVRSDASNLLLNMTLTAAPAGFHLYSGATSADPQSDIYFNSLILAETPRLEISGHSGMVVDQTNVLIITRTGPTNTSLDVNLSSDDTNVLTVPATVTMGVGESSVEAEAVGVGRGSATVTFLATGFAPKQADIEVYNVAFDSASYYEAGTWTNESNGGTGWGAWMLTNNNGAGEGYTNFAGAFLGDSTASGGGDVNDPSGVAFGLYANQTGTGGNPFSEAYRDFGPMAPGWRITMDMGVNYRNGAKGVVIQSGDTWLFEVAVLNNDYMYANWGDGDSSMTSLGWEYAADSAIQVELTCVGPDRYNIFMFRTGSSSEALMLEGYHLGGLSPDRVRFYVNNTEGGGENNLFFNHMGIDVFKVLTLEGVVNIDIEGTSVVYIARSGPTNEALTVNLHSEADDVVTVPETVAFGIGESLTTFEAVGVSESLTFIRASATNFVGAPLLVDVFAFPNEWDSSGNYLPGVLVPATFTNGGNAGAGFEPWVFSALADNAFIELRNSYEATAWMNAYNDRSFAFNGGTNYGYATASRELSVPLDPGDKFSCVLGMNWSGGNRGLDVYDTSGTKLFNFNLAYENIYTYLFDGMGAGVDLGWSYSTNAVVQVQVEQLAGGLIDVTLTRNDGLVTNVTSTSALLPVGRIQFYNGGHDAADIRQTLYANDLLITRSQYTDGIPNAWWSKYGIPEGSRQATNDYDEDLAPNGDEYTGDTDPNDITRSFVNKIQAITGTQLFTLQIGPNTTNSRTYDVWWSTNLMADPQEWTSFDFNAPADAGGGSIQLTVTNDAAGRFYRTGVHIP